MKPRCQPHLEIVRVDVAYNLVQHFLHLTTAISWQAYVCQGSSVCCTWKRRVRSAFLSALNARSVRVNPRNSRYSATTSSASGIPSIPVAGRVCRSFVSHSASYLMEQVEVLPVATRWTLSSRQALLSQKQEYGRPRQAFRPPRRAKSSGIRARIARGRLMGCVWRSVVDGGVAVCGVAWSMEVRWVK